nr:DUF2577 family protein [uncultured Caproiciproducens sp.]
MFVTVEQCKRIIQAYLDHTGRGGFQTGIVSSTAPLKIRISAKLELEEDDLYVTDNCIGLKKGSEIFRQSLKAGDGVLLLCRPGNRDGIKYILLDRIQPYKDTREVSP